MRYNGGFRAWQAPAGRSPNHSHDPTQAERISSLQLTRGQFPRFHTYAAATLVVVVVAAASVPSEPSIEPIEPSIDGGALTDGGSLAPLEVVPPESPDAAAMAALATTSPAASPAARIGLPTTPAIAPAAPLEAEWQVAAVRRNDTLERLFRRHGLSPADLQCLIESGPLDKRLHEVHPGDEIKFTADAVGGLTRLSYSPRPLERLEFERGEAGCDGRRIEAAPVVTTAARHAVIDHSLWLAGTKSGLNDRVIVALAKLFQWDIDFVLDIRKGDEFSLVYEEHHHEGEFIGFEILAAEFVNQGRAYRAVRYVDEAGERDYYSPDGARLRKAFLRAPVEFTRISSNFNLFRRHPLFNRSMPHRGIDYAAPTGTPVLAAGDGRVVVRGRTRPNGNYIVLQHGQAFQTKYLHLSGFGRGVRKGSRVRQGDVIGYVGATGYATGPHLHYEFLVDGVHRNPRTVKLPPASPVAAAERPRFLDTTRPLLARLDDYQAHRLATTP